MKMTLLVSLYWFPLYGIDFIDFLRHIIEKYSLGMFNDQTPGEDKNDLIALKKVDGIINRC